MKYSLFLFTPTNNRRLNELVGFCLLAIAALITLALISYSPSDPSWNTVAASARPHNWIGIFGATFSDALFQLFGVGAFALPALTCALAVRWFRSRWNDAALPKIIGGLVLLLFLPALFGILPWHMMWHSAMPMEGMEGRIVADFLLHYLNWAGAWIVVLTVMAVAVFLTTTFTFTAA